MSWWIGYAELYFAKEYYPGMSTQKIDEALVRYDSVAEDRNFGK
jgi:undecaprenyl pyrophosphate synthase